jgi:hypothetical protein
MRNSTRLNVLVARDSHGKVGPVASALLTSGVFNVSVYGVCALSRLPDFISDDTHGVVLLLSDRDDSVDPRELVSRFPETAFLFVAPRKPAPSALARLADALGTGLVTADEAPVVIAATLTSLLAQHARRAALPDRATHCLQGSV